MRVALEGPGVASARSLGYPRQRCVGPASHHISCRLGSCRGNDENGAIGAGNMPAFNNNMQALMINWAHMMEPPGPNSMSSLSVLPGHRNQAFADDIFPVLMNGSIK